MEFFSHKIITNSKIIDKFQGQIQGYYLKQWIWFGYHYEPVKNLNFTLRK